jgi:hypothetical protein
MFRVIGKYARAKPRLFQLHINPFFVIPPELTAAIRAPLDPVSYANC